MKVIGWKAWYANGSIYCSGNLDWSDLPDNGVIAIRLMMDEVVKSSGNHYRHILSGADYYFRATVDGKPIYGTVSDLAIIDGPKEHTEDALIKNRYPDADIKYGETVSDEEFDRIMKQVISRQDE